MSKQKLVAILTLRTNFVINLTASAFCYNIETHEQTSNAYCIALKQKGIQYFHLLLVLLLKKINIKNKATLFLTSILPFKLLSFACGLLPFYPEFSVERK